ncbi:MAG: hypothetical protein GY712_02465 [Oceanicoccus sp.]|uniref:hypothetical protein n=1 Tax=Oceanicoccus sp. TaxID=2691044 RepID=UPI002622224C|nr:hypothetical protein [Oceanicoccus sp.]MCP3906858.1 hypothetical protein [Oceanicoccus sp.]
MSKFNSKSLRVHYGSRTHNLKLSTELSVELMQDREIYVRGTYRLPFAQRRMIWLKEKKQIFKKKKAIPANASEVILTQNGIPYQDDIPSGETISITVGLLFK